MVLRPANWAASILIALLLSATSGAFAQVEGMQAFDNRLEGTNVHNNALEDFNILAVHRDFRTFGTNSILRVRFYLPQAIANQEKTVFVEATELQDSFHYFMQAKPSGKWNYGNRNVFGPWPTRDVIDRLGLQSGNIGVRAGYRLKNGPPVFVPVDVYQDTAQSPGHSYTFHFITGSDLQSLEVSVANRAGISVAGVGFVQRCNRAFNPGCKLYAAGSTHSFSLDMSKLPEGEYHVRLLGHVPGTLIPTSLDILVFHSL